MRPCWRRQVEKTLLELSVSDTLYRIVWGAYFHQAQSKVLVHLYLFLVYARQTSQLEGTSKAFGMIILERDRTYILFTYLIAIEDILMGGNVKPFQMSK